MSQASGNQHQGVFVEDVNLSLVSLMRKPLICVSMSDLIFNGGQNAVFFGNQQFTVRNFTINNANNAITWLGTGVCFPSRVMWLWLNVDRLDIQIHEHQ